jgi:hypothetical protein
MDNPYCDLPYWWWFWQLTRRTPRWMPNHEEHQHHELQASTGHCIDLMIWHPEY